MSVESEAKQSLLLDFEAYARARQVFAQKVAVANTEREVMVMLGSVAPYADNAFLPHTVVFMTHPHFEEFVQVVNKQLQTIKQSRGPSDEGA